MTSDNWTIRKETEGDRAEIAAVTNHAFEGKSYSDGSEGSLPGRLRDAGHLLLGLVCVDENRVIGHVAFSPASIDGRDGWVALGPLSVTPELQGRGIGGRLVRKGLTEMRGLGVKGCVLIGDPAYYERFGFEGNGALSYRDVPRPYVQWLSFGSDAPSGPVQFAPAFESAA
jgi:putative acetyltransferase